jgi:hypothetical protein
MMKDERIVQINTTDDNLIALTDKGRIFVRNRHAAIDNWREIPPPQLDPPAPMPRAA